MKDDYNMLFLKFVLINQRKIEPLSESAATFLLACCLTRHRLHFLRFYIRLNVHKVRGFCLIDFISKYLICSTRYRIFFVMSSKAYFMFVPIAALVCMKPMLYFFAYYNASPIDTSCSAISHLFPTSSST
jgi:hypothetical protein